MRTTLRASKRSHTPCPDEEGTKEPPVISVLIELQSDYLEATSTLSCKSTLKPMTISTFYFQHKIYRGQYIVGLHITIHGDSKGWIALTKGS